MFFMELKDSQRNLTKCRQNDLCRTIVSDDCLSAMNKSAQLTSFEEDNRESCLAYKPCLLYNVKPNKVTDRTWRRNADSNFQLKGLF